MDYVNTDVVSDGEQEIIGEKEDLGRSDGAYETLSKARGQRYIDSLVHRVLSSSSPGSSKADPIHIPPCRTGNETTTRPLCLYSLLGPPTTCRVRPLLGRERLRKVEDYTWPRSEWTYLWHLLYLVVTQLGAEPRSVVVLAPSVIVRTGADSKYCQDILLPTEIGERVYSSDSGSLEVSASLACPSFSVYTLS